jgi:hypothetical protein
MAFVRARPRVCHYALLRRLVQGIMTTHLLILLTSKSRKAILGILGVPPEELKTCESEGLFLVCFAVL